MSLKTPLLEVIALDAADAEGAQAGGADRLELVADPGPGQQAVGDRCSAVAQRDQPMPGRLHRAAPAGHVRMHRQLLEAGHDVLDRILVAQALLEGLTLVSADAALDAFGIARLW